MADYRDDDQTVGYCPKCGRHTGETLHGLTVEGQGYCDLHGWVFANWSRPAMEEWAEQHDETEYLRMEEKLDRAGEA